MNMFAPATRKKLKLRMAIDGPSGSGKTFTALRCATALGSKIVAIDTEHGSMAKYKGDAPDGIPWKWDCCELTHFDPQNYTIAIQEAKRLKPDVLIIDSLSHAWEGIGGALEQVSKSSSVNKYTAWKDVTPKHQKMVQAILSFPGHVIATMRSKMDYVLEADGQGKMVPRKVGMAPIQRPGTEYEFDVVCELDCHHVLLVTKTRCSAVDGLRVEKPGPEFMQPIIAWLNDGTDSLGPGPATEAVVQPAESAPVSTNKVYEMRDGKATAFIPVSSGELMAGAMTEVAPSPDTSGQARCSAEQQDQIKSLAKKLGMTRAALLKVLGKRGVTTTAGLTVDQAADIQVGLARKLQDRQKLKDDLKDIPF